MLERDDIGSSTGDGVMTAMKRALEPHAEARDDYAIFALIAAKLGAADAFTEGRDVMSWLRHLYDESLPRAVESGLELPSFDDFWAKGVLEYPRPARPNVLLRAFREDPLRNPLATPSGRIELFSEKLAGLGYPECPGHPVWLPSDEFLGSERASTYPLHMLSPQPAHRLHSQYDHGSVSLAHKIKDREPMTMSSADAAARGLRTGDVARVFNDRGAILVGIQVSDAIRPGVVQLSTGAWYDPLMPGEIGTLDKHGNPNVLTPDRGSSRLGQGCAAQSTLVEVERWSGPLPPVTAHLPPPFVVRAETRSGGKGHDR
jgi:biotin/methionine sulfoxide reductase